MLEYFANSLLYSVLATAGTLLSGIPAAYALAKLRWRGQNLFFMLAWPRCCCRRRSPSCRCTAVGRLGLTGTLVPLIVPYFFFDAFCDLPAPPVLPHHSEGLLRRGQIDGCNEFQAMYRVLVPMTKPGIAAAGLFCFLYTWNDYFGPLLYIGENQDQLAALGGAGVLPRHAPGAVEHDDGRDRSRPGAGDRAVPVRAEVVRQGDHFHGSQRDETRCRRGRFHLHAGADRRDRRPAHQSGRRRDRARRPGRGAPGRRRPVQPAPARPRRSPGQGSHHQRSGGGCRRCVRRTVSAAGRRADARAAPTRRSRTSATASARRRPAPAGWRRRCARSRWCWTSPTGCARSPARTRGSSTSPTRSAS